MREMTIKRPLREDLAETDAVDSVFAILSPQTHSNLSVSRGWTHEKFVAWATRLLRRELWG